MNYGVTSLVWFRNDLRLHDNEALASALRRSHYVLPVYVLDPRQLAASSTTARGFRKTGQHRTRFLLESLHDLQTRLRECGSDLLLLYGKPEELLPHLAHAVHAEAVFFHEEVTDEEVRIEEALIASCRRENIRTHSFFGATLFHIDDLPFSIDHLPDVFTTFRKQVERQCTVRPTFPAPTRSTMKPLPEAASPLLTGIADISSDVVSHAALSDNHSLLHSALVRTIPSLSDFGFSTAATTSDSRAVLQFVGGESSALERLQQYIWDGNHLQCYKETRNGLLGSDYSSKFSPWLSHGCLSPRLVYEEVKRYERERVKNDSTYWLIFELLWRDFFRFVAFAWGNQLFFEGGLKNAPATWTNDWSLFERWQQGTTGIPFIDANMRELAATGFMSNRGRQNVASFLVRDLNLHWLLGAEWFESQLVDYDVCSNYGNWNYAAGVGNDPRENRYFNIIRQATMYDPHGTYVKHWLPELCSLPSAYVHEPHKLSREQQQRYGVAIGVDYPQPVVNLEVSSKRFQR